MECNLKHDWHFIFFLVGSARQNDRASQWDWRLVFKKLIPDLARSVEHSIQETCQGALARPEAMLQTTSVRAELVGGRLDYPKVISKVSGESITNTWIIIKTGIILYYKGYQTHWSYQDTQFAYPRIAIILQNYFWSWNLLSALYFWFLVWVIFDIPITLSASNVVGGEFTYRPGHTKMTIKMV